MADPHKLSTLPDVQSSLLLGRLEGVIFDHCCVVFSDNITEVPDASLLGIAGELRNMVYHAIRTQELDKIAKRFQQQTPKNEVLGLPVQQKTLSPPSPPDPERLMLVSWDELCSEFARCLPEISSEPHTVLESDDDECSQLSQGSWQTTVFGSEAESEAEIVQSGSTKWKKNPYLGLTQVCRKLRAEFRPLYKMVVGFRGLPAYLLFRDPNNSTAREVSYVLWAALAAGDRYRPESSGIPPVRNIPLKIDLLPLLKVDWKNIDCIIQYPSEKPSPQNRIARVVTAIMTRKTPLQYLFRNGIIDNVALVPGPSKHELVPTLEVTPNIGMHGTSNTQPRKLVYQRIEQAFRDTACSNAWVEMFIPTGLHDGDFIKINEDGDIEED